MEGVEQVHDEEEREEQGDVSEGEALEGEVRDLSLKVNDKVTLHQPELCLIYTALHWACRSDGTPWSYVEIKQIVGHTVLKLDEDKYQSLDLTSVIKLLHREEDQYTGDLKLIAEKSKKLFVSWFQQLREKYSDMCREDEKLAKQSDYEGSVHQEAQQATAQIRSGKRRRHEEPGPVPSRLSGGSQGGQQAGNTTRPGIEYPSIAAVLAGSSSWCQDCQGRTESM